jgi:hypothetical protein
MNPRVAGVDEVLCLPPRLISTESRSILLATFTFVMISSSTSSLILTVISFRLIFFAFVLDRYLLCRRSRKLRDKFDELMR